jgi:uncharacterized protein
MVAIPLTMSTGDRGIFAKQGTMLAIWILGVIAAIGALAGLLAGLLGVGGGIVIVPALRWLSGSLSLPASHVMHIAVATSMAVIVPTTLRSAFAHHARGSVDLAKLRHWAPFAALGSFVAGLAAGHIPTEGLSLVFGIVAVWAGTRMAAGRADRRQPLQLTPVIDRTIATTIGILSCWMGIGGGTLSVPTLTWLGMPPHHAVGTGAALGATIAVPGLAGLVWSGRHVADYTPWHLGFVDLRLMAILLPFSLLCAPLGVKLAHRLPAAQLKRVFGIFLCLAAGSMLLSVIHTRL